MGAPNPRGSKRDGPALTGQSPTTAKEVVASLALPGVSPAVSPPVTPLSMADLSRLPRDASMLYDIVQVDGAGRVASKDITDALHWQPSSRLDVIVTPRTIVIRAAPGGLFFVPRRPRIIIPSHARRPHGIRPGDHVLIAAAPDYDLVIVYPLSALDEMISRYHSAESEAETPQ